MKLLKNFKKFETKKKNENENLKSDFNKFFDIINKIYFIYFTSNDEKFNIKNSISEIKLIKEKNTLNFNDILKQISNQNSNNEDNKKN